ncbi:MAG TPA: LacI family DNA-binding transcriptional regulator [Xanthomonadales bacterium]
MGSGKTTSFDIAHRAGVSQATVSRALRDSPLVNTQTREKIKKIARELNYHVDRAAAGLRSQHSHTLAILLFEDPTSDDSQINPFFLSMLGNITRAAARRNYDVLVSFQQLSDDWHLKYQLSNRADGIILLGYGDYSGFADKVDKLIKAGTCFTVWGATGPELEDRTIGCDNVDGAFQATSHLLRLGRRKIAFFGGTSDNCPELKQRYDGYCKALTEAGINIDPGLQFDTDFQETSGAWATEELLKSGKPFDAIFAASDLLAIGAIKRLRTSGVRVPIDVSVVGFDDIPAASYFNPSLTTVQQNTITASKHLVNQVIRQIKGKKPKLKLLEPILMVRHSCGGKPRGNS